MNSDNEHTPTEPHLVGDIRQCLQTLNCRDSQLKSFLEETNAYLQRMENKLQITNKQHKIAQISFRIINESYNSYNPINTNKQKETPTDTIIQWNLNGFYIRLPELQLLVEETQPTVICLQETNLKLNTTRKKHTYPKISGYTGIFTSTSPNYAKHGFCILVKSGISVTEIPQDLSKAYDTCWHFGILQWIAGVGVGVGVGVAGLLQHYERNSHLAQPLYARATKIARELDIDLNSTKTINCSLGPKFEPLY
jgi:hypothetical protein